MMSFCDKYSQICAILLSFFFFFQLQCTSKKVSFWPLYQQLIEIGGERNFH
jgi:hypothetical protein